jgi:ElaB/YqjD/DUF883 family membrane-anchored ribosome-binding protein
MEIDNDDEQKLIQQQMEETRASLSTKLEALENQVAETVQTATDAVQTTTEVVAETVESVKESVGEIRERVGDTVRSVASLFDISRQVEERPWLVFGGSIGVGCLIGWVLRSGKSGQKTSAPPPSFAAEPPAVAAAPTWQAPPEPTKPSWLSQEFSRLRGLAIGLAMGTVRDLARQTLPDTFSGRVAEMVDNLTPQLGGEVVHAQILPDLKAGTDVEAGSDYPAPRAQAEPDVRPGAFETPPPVPAPSRAYAGAS